MLLSKSNMYTHIISMWRGNGQTEPSLILIVDSQTICPKLLRLLARLSVIYTVGTWAGAAHVRIPYLVSNNMRVTWDDNISPPTPC